MDLSSGPTSSAQGCLRKIESLIGSFSPSELRIAQYVLRHPRKVLESTIENLARECDVSKASVVRFYQSLGFQGYKAFLINIAQELGAVIPETEEDINFQGDVAHLAKSVFEMNMRAIQSTLEALDFAQVERAIDVMAQARRIEFYGTGSSNAVAMDAYYKFLRIGLAGNFDSNPHIHAISASLLTEEDVCCGLSYSGSTADVIEAMAIARQAGAKVIGITNFGDMPIAEVSDILLTIKVDENLFKGGVAASRCAQIALIDVLYVGVLNRHKERFMTHFDKTKSALLAKLVARSQQKDVKSV